MADESDSQNVSGGGGRYGGERRVTPDSDVYFNAQFNAKPIYVQPGRTGYGQREDEMLVASVGAGMLLSVYDQELKMGALGYVLLPEPVLDCFPFVDRADPVLVAKAFEPLEGCIGEMKKHGAGKARLMTRLFGGAVCDDDPDERGLKNMVFVKEYLCRQGLNISNADIGGPFMRRVHFFPATGRVVRRLLKRQEDFDIVRAAEGEYNKIITSCD
ncbi:MAG: hypothetical protein R3E13_05670 [Alphaproteobacteria bacterium]